MPRYSKYLSMVTVYSSVPACICNVCMHEFTSTHTYTHTLTPIFFQMNTGEKYIRETFQKEIKIVMVVTKPKLNCKEMLKDECLLNMNMNR